MVKLDLIRLPKKSERLHQAVMQNFRLVLKTELEIKLVVVLCKLCVGSASASGLSC